jgi:hypothetical protein
VADDTVANRDILVSEDQTTESRNNDHNLLNKIYNNIDRIRRVPIIFRRLACSGLESRFIIGLVYAAEVRRERYDSLAVQINIDGVLPCDSRIEIETSCFQSSKKKNRELQQRQITLDCVANKEKGTNSSTKVPVSIFLTHRCISTMFALSSKPVLIIGKIMT